MHYCFLCKPRFVSGASSITSLLDGSGLEETMLRKYTRQILEGLAFLHGHSIIHGDIKVDSFR